MPKQNHHAATAPSSIDSEKPNKKRRRARIGARLRGGASASSRAGVGCKRWREDLDKGRPIGYDASAEIEDEYRLFLENMRVYRNGNFVVEYDGKVIRYGEGEVGADGGNREDPDESSDDSIMSFLEPDPLDDTAPWRKTKKVTDIMKEMDKENEAVVPIKGKGTCKGGKNRIGK
uniref:Uncharacterized protein n=1 Tax=Leersia perrieri TaxID=77586 RepID=A0A0D9W2R3_9ORYZ